MRIKINGPITPERLTEALAAATTRLGDDCGGFFNANLYVHAYNKDGEEIALCGADGKQVTLLMALPPGMPMQPPMASEVIERRRRQLEQRKELEAQERAQREHEERVRCAQVEQRMKAKEAAAKAHHASVQQFESLLAKHGDALITQLNAIVANVWETRKPRWPHGKDKGEVRARPVFAWNAEVGKVWLYRSPDKTGSARAIQSPVHYLDSQRNIQQYWQYEEWRIVAQTIQRFLTDLERNEVGKSNAGGL
jgi:hypothetical protein